MAAAEQIKSLIKSFGEGDDARFYATAMQIAAAEARNGKAEFAEELKKLIDKAKANIKKTGIIRNLPVNISGKEISDLLELSYPNFRLKDMVLSSQVEKTLQRVLDEQRKLELLAQHNLTPRKKLLFIGPPGCGKTLSANVLASELNIPLFTIRMDGLISRYMGESITKLRMIFDTMHQFRAVYLFDEFDSIGTTRMEGNEVGEIKRILNTFLLQIEKDVSNSLIIAATNLPEKLDAALLRRFDDIVSFPLPTQQEIYQLYQHDLAGFARKDYFEMETMAAQSIGLSYADVHRISEELVKECLIYGEESVSEERFKSFIMHRKHPFQN